MKVYVEVYGCTANKADASLIKGIIKESEHELVKSLDDANALVILTCTVIDTTEQRMISLLKKLKETGKRIVVAGCMASVQSEKIKSIVPNADLLPPRYSHHIIDVLNNRKIDFLDKNKTAVPKYFDDIFAQISIAEGCMFSCSYCITTLARGKLKSYPISEINRDAYIAVKNGCKEIQLTSQDTSSYGFDSNNDLGDLLRELSMLKGDFRIRVGMMNPYTCLKNIDSILDGYDDPKIYKFVHLPVQSGDDEILEKMNRKYSVYEFFKIIKRFREKYPEISVSTDIIVGFPSETDEHFQHTIDLLEIVKPDITNITRFSARPLTKAKEFKDRIKTEIVKERSKRLTSICSKISKENNQRHIGKKYTVLITEKGKKNTFVGRTENYKPVVIKEKVRIGEFIHVKIINAEQTYLVGSII